MENVHTGWSNGNTFIDPSQNNIRWCLYGKRRWRSTLYEHREIVTTASRCSRTTTVAYRPFVDSDNDINQTHGTWLCTRLCRPYRRSVWTAQAAGSAWSRRACGNSCPAAIRPPDGECRSERRTRWSRWRIVVAGRTTLVGAKTRRRISTLTSNRRKTITRNR